ncbi:MAG: adenylyl-sulfate kinase [Bacteroidales bacterium]|nr:adenylyl-sulfate kinase [Bacteroidales bacterium]
MKKENNIFTVFNQIVNKEQKEHLLKQKAKVLWFTGLSGSGKTTLGAAIEKELFNRGYLTQILDGDNIRSGINKNLTFTETDRVENIRRIAEVTKLFLNCGVIAINCFISPTKESRNMAKSIIGKENLIEVYVSTPIEVCEQRDTKGLYAKARRGELKNFTGISSPFEIPQHPDIIVNTDELTLEESTKKILTFLLKKIKY